MLWNAMKKLCDKNPLQKLYKLVGLLKVKIKSISDLV